MPSCAFDKCRNHSRILNKTHGISFHAFPHDESWCYKWLRVVRQQRQEPTWLHTGHSRVCSLHFKPEDMYTTEKGRKRIHHGAVPFWTHIAINLSRSNSPHSSDSDRCESASEADKRPESTFLKRKIEKVIADKKRLFQLNGNLKRRNKRLSQKCTCLQNMVLNLEKKVSELESRTPSTE